MTNDCAKISATTSAETGPDASFKEHLAILIRLAQERECVYTMEFLSIAADSYMAESELFERRRRGEVHGVYTPASADREN